MQMTAGIAGLVALMALPTTSDTPKALQGVHRIVTLGDSITEGGGQPGGYVWLLGQTLARLYPDQKFEIVNAGISGHKATDMQARFQRDVLDKKPDMVTISVGVNDVWHGFFDFAAGKRIPDGSGPNGVPIPLYRQKLSEMIEAAQKANVRVVLLAPTIIYEDLSSAENKSLTGYIAVMRELAAKYLCLYVDMNAPFHRIIAARRKQANSTENYLTTDGVHMNPVGNKLMAYTLLRGLGVPDNLLSDLKVR
jgi:lysophospholipase L1-like esterase